MLTLTTGLGVWQLQRLAWKRALLADIERGEAGPPTPLGPDAAPFRRVVVDGAFLPISARYGAEVRSTAVGPAMGAHVIAALARPGADPIIIDRGWAPASFDPVPPTGPVHIVGYIRPPEYPVRFGAQDDPVSRQFYALDPVAIGASFGLTHVAPFTLVALGADGAFPAPATALPQLPNDHLSYAVTWFSLSAALAIIFVLYVCQARPRDAPH